MHLYSNNLSAKAKISSSNNSDFLPACFSCSTNFNLPQNSSGLSGKNIVESSPESTIAVGLSNPKGDLTLVLLMPQVLSTKNFSSAKSDIVCCPLV